MVQSDIDERVILRNMLKRARRPLTTLQIAKFTKINYIKVRKQLESLHTNNLIDKIDLKNRIYWSYDVMEVQSEG